MELFPKTRTARAQIAAFALLFSVAGGYSVYETTTQPDQQACEHPRPLEKVNLKSVPGANFVGPVEVTNEGPCTAVYDRASLKTVANVATGESFDVTCVDSQPNSFQVTLGDEKSGYVNYSNSFKVTNGPGYDHPLIPGC
jgi:hypothetical protein